MSEPLVLSQKTRESFDKDGAVCLRGVFSQEWVKKVAAGIETNLQNPSRYSECLRASGGPGSYFNDYCNWQKIPEFRDYVFNSQAAEIAGTLMQSQYAVFYHEHVLTKEPGTFKVTPWHHDQAYYPVDGFKACSIWMPIDPVSEETTIQFVRGSHKWGKWFHPRKFATEKNYSVERDNSGGKVFEDAPDVDSDRHKYEILQWAVEPGDCVVFHMKTLHGAPSNKSSRPRRVLSTRWLGDDTVLAERPWEVSPPILGGLKTGDQILCDTFPLIWKQS